LSCGSTGFTLEHPTPLSGQGEGGFARVWECEFASSGVGRELCLECTHVGSGIEENLGKMA